MMPSKEDIVRAAETAAREHVMQRRHYNETAETIARHAGIDAGKAADAWVATQHLHERQVFMDAFFLRVGKELSAQ